MSESSKFSHEICFKSVKLIHSHADFTEIQPPIKILSLIVLNNFSSIHHFAQICYLIWIDKVFQQFSQWQCNIEQRNYSLNWLAKPLLQGNFVDRIITVNLNRGWVISQTSNYKLIIYWIKTRKIIKGWVIPQTSNYLLIIYSGKINKTI